MIRLSFALLFITVVATSLVVPTLFPQPRFIPPHLVTASDINYPINSVASGLVEIEIELDGTGHRKNLSVIRNVSSLTSAALLAIDNWTFAPAKTDGEPQASVLFGNIVFDPGIFNPSTILLPPEGTSPSARDAEFVGPRVSRAFYPKYPINSIGTGAVVLDVTVDRMGHVGASSVVYSEPSLTKPAIDAVKGWSFRPGTFRKVPVTARTIIAFVFRPANISRP